MEHCSFARYHMYGYDEESFLSVTEKALKINCFICGFFILVQKKKHKKKEQEQKGILVPGEKKLTSKQVNVLLKKFPPN
jgi:hypothetical protein